MELWTIGGGHLAKGGSWVALTDGKGGLTVVRITIRIRSSTGSQRAAAASRLLGTVRIQPNFLLCIFKFLYR